MSEAEATAIRFTIDHYEPVSSRPDLEDDYRNLMYACDFCNRFKGDACPPPEARQVGNRFYRPDSDAFSDHFEEIGLRLKPKTTVGDFTIEMVELNRHALTELRRIRRRLYEVDEYVVEGLQGLRRVTFGKLPRGLRERAILAKARAERTARSLADAIDEVLAADAKSPLIDPDPYADERTKERAAYAKSLRRSFPGSWRKRHR